jgi:hypothetical protein
MTRKEFENIRVEIEREEFVPGNLDPINFGIQRAEFEICKYKKLIAAARSVDSKTTRAKVSQWKRLASRASESKGRFQKLQMDMLRDRNGTAPNGVIANGRPSRNGSSSF